MLNSLIIKDIYKILNDYEVVELTPDLLITILSKEGAIVTREEYDHVLGNYFPGIESDENV